YRAPNTPQFWLVWTVLCMNVSAGIRVIGMASPMLQELFGGQLVAVDLPSGALSETQRQAVASIGAGYTGLLSLFNILGRIGWSSLSDYLGRKTTYHVFFALGMFLYACAPASGHLGSVALFVGIVCVIISMYGGSFATVPAYLADIFGTQFVGAILGRLLTAWATARCIGHVCVIFIRVWR